MAILELHSIAHQFVARRVLGGIGLALVAVEFVPLAGSSHTGKSKLIKIACGLLKPSSGSVSLGFQNILPSILTIGLIGAGLNRLMGLAQARLRTA